MSQQTLNAFIAIVQTDNGLLEQMKVATDAAAAIAIAKTAGFEITAADLIRHQAAVVDELSDKELEGVAGGFCSAMVSLLFTASVAITSGTITGLYAANKLG